MKHWFYTYMSKRAPGDVIYGMGRVDSSDFFPFRFVMNACAEGNGITMKDVIILSFQEIDSGTSDEIALYFKETP
jgi:hypothetical protein